MVNGFSCILDFPKFSGGEPPDPRYKGNTSIKPSTTTAAKGNKKEPESPHPIKTIYTKFIIRLYRNWKKKDGAGARSFLCDL